MPPSNFTFVWDRLPISLGFIAFVAIILGEHIDPALGRHSLAPLLATGLASVG